MLASAVTFRWSLRTESSKAEGYEAWQNLGTGTAFHLGSVNSGLCTVASSGGASRLQSAVIPDVAWEPAAALALLTGTLDPAFLQLPK